MHKVGYLKGLCILYIYICNSKHYVIVSNAYSNIHKSKHCRLTLMYYSKLAMLVKARLPSYFQPPAVSAIFKGIFVILKIYNFKYWCQVRNLVWRVEFCLKRQPLVNRNVITYLSSRRKLFRQRTNTSV